MVPLHRVCALLFLILLLPTLPIRAAEAPLSLSLPEALKIAQERNVDVIVSDERVNQAISRIGQARSGLLPQLSASASQYRQTRNLAAVGIQIPGVSTFVGPFNTFDARLALTQAIFDGSSLERLRSARVGKTVSQAEAEKTKQDVLALVATLYLDARREQESVSLAQNLLKQGEERLRLARSRLQLDLGTSLDVTQLTAERADNQSRLTQALTQAVEKRLDLTAALGLPADTRLLFPTKDLFLPSAQGGTDERSAWVNSHPDVHLAEKNVEQQKAERKVAKSDYYPKIFAQADYGASGAHPGDAVDTYSVGGQLTFPFYQGGLTQAKMKEAKSRIRESEARLEDTRRQTESKIVQAQEALRRSWDLLQSTQSDLRSAQKQFSISRERLKTGLGTDLEVVETQTVLAQALDRVSEARTSYQLALVNLAHAQGKMETLTENRKETSP